jgi:uncharacterized membrane protein
MVLIVGILILILFLPSHLFLFNGESTWSANTSSTHQPARMLLPKIQSLNTLSPSTAYYDEQIGETFTQSFTSMAYNVTAVPQVDESGYGPAYLLNGLSNTGYWYQVGLSYDWSGIGTGFAMVYEIWDPSGKSIFPTTGGGGVQGFSGPVYAGDIVLLNLYFGTGSYAGDVVLYAYDYNTGAYAYKIYSAEGGNYFVGNSQSVANAEGFFTGLMTEEYHSNPYYGGEQFVAYFNHQFTLSSAWQWIDEKNVNTSQVLFSSVTPSPVKFDNYHQLHYFSSNGASEYSDAYVLDTGSDPVSLSLSASPVNADVGTAAHASFSATATGGTSPYTYLVYLDNNLISNYTSSGTYSASLNLGTLSAGNHTYYIDAIDSNGYPASSQSVTFTVNLDPILTISAQQVTADQGQNVFITYMPVFGTPPYTMTLYINGVAASQVNTEFANLQRLGQNQVYATLTDAAGYTVKSNVLTIQVNPDPVATLNQTRVVTDMGLPVTYTESTVNGTAPYYVSWFVNGQKVSQSGTTFRFVPNSTGTFVIYAQVTDGAGYAVNSTQSRLTVNMIPSISSFTSTGESTNFFLSNNTAVSTVAVSGGTSPLSYSWYLNGQKVAQTTTPSYTYTFSKMGPNMLWVNVSDAVGYTVASTQIMVSYTYDYLHIGIVVAIAVVLALLVFLMIQRRKARTIIQTNNSTSLPASASNQTTVTPIGEISSSHSPQDPIEVLKLRYAKGEITKEQFEEAIRVLEDAEKENDW